MIHFRGDWEAGVGEVQDPTFRWFLLYQTKVRCSYTKERVFGFNFGGLRRSRVRFPMR
jgi:alpha/beta superfamily hydrolase